ncbi:MAG: histidinol dehydrogenase [Melioribacteraceae bacterium]|nr:histidinol dehydrogenase [Melioribacteraceae bacterium]
MKIIIKNSLSQKKLIELFKRPAQNNNSIKEKVSKIIYDVKKNGHKSVLKYAKKFDGLNSDSILITKKYLNEQSKIIDIKLERAIDVAYNNIYKFHIKQIPKTINVETQKGIVCEKKYLPIESVGLYIPGGSAVLFSTLLMLGIPAKIAGCKRIVVCSPVKNEIDPALAYVAKKIGIEEFYSVGGAHAISMLAYGTEQVKKVDKIFGPGNQFVTLAKQLISIDNDGSIIDMPAGPSEVLIIADKFANPSFVAADLLSQAEHGIDSQVILLTDDINLAKNVLAEINKQLKTLPKKEIANKCLKKSFILIVDDLNDAVKLSNNYAPEHLIINVKNINSVKTKIKNAGSVFLGSYSPESVGDYASGTNHSLPTYGYAKSIGGVDVLSFMKSITFQKLTKKGLKNLSSTVIEMAEAENLQAHANAIKVRLK